MPHIILCFNCVTCTFDRFHAIFVETRDLCQQVITAFALISPKCPDSLKDLACGFADDIFKCIFANEKFYILITVSLKLVPRSPIDHKAALVLVMVWHRVGDKPLSEPMLTWFTDAYMQHQGRWVYNTLRPIYTFCRQHFWMRSLEWKLLYVYSNSTVICSQGFNRQYVRTGSDSGLRASSQIMA